MERDRIDEVQAHGDAVRVQEAREEPQQAREEPQQALTPEERVMEASEESFPASDAPGWITGSATPCEHE